MRVATIARRLHDLRRVIPGALFVNLYSRSFMGREGFGVVVEFLTPVDFEGWKPDQSGKRIILGGERTIRQTLTTAERNTRLLLDSIRCSECGRVGGSA